MRIVNFPQEMVKPKTAAAASSALAGWRRDAARLAAELLREVSPAAADEVLDLRMALLDGSVTAGGVLRAFFAARNRLESEHYLLFFRLRRVLEPALGVEVTVPGGEARREAIDFRHRDVRQMIRSLRRDRFEHDLTVVSPEAISVRIVWRFTAEPAVA